MVDGPIARVVITEVQGSAPREVGAAMLVWAGGQSGTIGGGALEYQAAQAARDLLALGGVKRVTRVALGPSLGQCCGGAVGLLTEVYDRPPTGILARPLGAAGDMPLAVARLLAQSRQAMVAPQLIQGWFVEQITPPARPLWIWGAGHVGRAIVSVLSPLMAITWVDTGLDRFPYLIPDGVRALPAVDPVTAVGLAPPEAEHLILTFSHVLDLALCDALLRHGFGGCGLIGSATKWARFRARLAGLGHSPAEIARIACPIGDPSLGKHPQAIAIGVAMAMMKPAAARSAADVR